MAGSMNNNSEKKTRRRKTIPHRIVEILDANDPMNYHQLSEAINEEYPQVNFGVLKTSVNRMVREDKVRRVGYGIVTSKQQFDTIQKLKYLCKDQKVQINHLMGEVDLLRNRNRELVAEKLATIREKKRMEEVMRAH